MKAIITLFKWILSANDSAFYSQPVLSLVAALVYMANALCNRPAEGKNIHLLRDGMLPRAKVPRAAISETHQRLHLLNRGIEPGDREEIVEGPDGEDVPYDEAAERGPDLHLVTVDDNGVFFLRGITFVEEDRVPTLTDAHRVQPCALENLFGVCHLGHLWMDATQGGDRSVIPLDRGPEAYRHTGRTQAIEVNPDSMSVFDLENMQRLFTLDARHITVGRFTMDEEDRGFQQLGDGSRLTADGKAKVILMQFAYDFFMKSVDERMHTLARTGGESWMALGYEDRCNATVLNFTKRELYGFFNRFKVKRNEAAPGRESSWDLSLKYFFPGLEPTFVVGGKKRQTWPFLRYLQWYEAIKATTTDKQKFLKFREQIVKVVNEKFKWLPFAQSERPYDSRVKDNIGYYPVDSGSTPAIILVFNPRFAYEMYDKNGVIFPGTGQVARQRAMAKIDFNAAMKRARATAFEEEEEEESEEEEHHRPHARH